MRNVMLKTLPCGKTANQTSPNGQAPGEKEDLAGILSAL